MISMELPIQNLLEENEEYLLVIQLESGDRMIYYYTRIIESQNSYVSECIDFVRQFNDTTFDSEKATSLSTYMEKTTGDNTTFAVCDIKQFTESGELGRVSWHKADNTGSICQGDHSHLQRDRSGLCCDSGRTEWTERIL